MKRGKNKVITDIVSMLFILIAIITGFILHNEVWHTHCYNDIVIWGVHETVGLILIVVLAIHCVQHSFWFKNYSKIQIKRKRVTTILLILGIVLGLTGIVLIFGSHSELISHIHYATGILFTIVAIGHVAKRWKMLKSLI